MTASTWPAIITVLNVLLLVWTGILVGHARGRYAIPAPATSGNADFERVFRVQMNTLESTVAFLPALWLASVYAPGALVAGAGLVWIGARVLYALSYMQDAAKRGAGFGISFTALAVLLIAAVIGMARQLLA